MSSPYYECDKCGTYWDRQPNGETYFKNDSWKVARDAREAGWQIKEDPWGPGEDLCPKCVQELR